MGCSPTGLGNLSTLTVIAGEELQLVHQLVKTIEKRDLVICEDVPETG